MSALTKLFVVLLVVLSILLTAGTVVFVNKTEKFADIAANAKREAQNAERSRSEAVLAAQNAESNRLSDARALMAQVTVANNAASQARGETASKELDLIALRSTNAQQLADISRLTDGLKASEESKTGLQTALADARTSGNDTMKRMSDLSQTVSDLTNRLDVAMRELRIEQEKNQQAQVEIERLTASQGAGVAAGGEKPAASSGGGGTEAAVANPPAINGVIRDVKMIGGIPYATISVGSADSVAKGMRFNVIDAQKGDFLGILTVQSVEPQEATGQLDGPQRDAIKAGNEVRTKL